MNWIKTADGYTAAPYILVRTAGRRWNVLFRDEQINDKQFARLSDAQAAAEQHAILELAKQQASALADQPRDQTVQELGQMLGVADPADAAEFAKFLDGVRADPVLSGYVNDVVAGVLPPDPPPEPPNPPGWNNLDDVPAPAPDVPPTPQTPVPAPYPRDLGDEPLAQTLDRLHDIKATLPFRVGRRRLTSRPRVAA